VRAARLAAAQRVVELANDRAVDALLLAGDTFEDNDVSRDDVQRVADIVGRCEAPVLILPANHDPLVPGSVWEHPAWKDKEPHVRVARGCEPFEVNGALFLPSPLSSRTSPQDPTDVFPAPPVQRDRIRIGVAHGSLRDAGVADDQIVDDFPIDRRAVHRAQLDYLALGHWHTPSVHSIDGVERIAYCGSHEPTKFGERSASSASGQCLVVTIEAPGAPPILEPVRTAVLEWRQSEHTITGLADVTALRAQIEQETANSKEHVLLDFALSGAIPPGAGEALDDLEILIGERFLFARVHRDALILNPPDDGWVDELPGGVPRAVARRLLEQATGADRSQVARASLDLLYRLSRGLSR
jgi:DNA repair exonuclease SbcCD nuclease subunit